MGMEMGREQAEMGRRQGRSRGGVEVGTTEGWRSGRGRGGGGDGGEVEVEVEMGEG